MAEKDDTSAARSKALVPVSSHFADVDINTSQRLSSVLLNEFNYLPWSRAIKIAHGGRSKLGFITGQTKTPDAISPEYETWLSKDQMVMSWILNSMERNLAELFNYSESSLDLWIVISDMYGNKNNSVHVFQIYRDIADLRQDRKSFVNVLSNLKNLWNELDIYRPHTVDAVILRKRKEEDQIFQLLACLGPEYEDLRSHIMMNPELPSLKSVCASVQREEVRQKVLPRAGTSNPSDVRAYVAHPTSVEKNYKGKRPDLKCQHCHNIGHSIDRCWILHPEIKPKFSRDQKGSYTKRNTDHKAHLAAQPAGLTTNPISLINDFAKFLQERRGTGQDGDTKDHAQATALLSQFAGFLTDANPETSQGPYYKGDDW